MTFQYAEDSQIKWSRVTGSGLEFAAGPSFTPSSLSHYDAPLPTPTRPEASYDRPLPTPFVSPRQYPSAAAPAPARSDDTALSGLSPDALSALSKLNSLPNLSAFSNLARFVNQASMKLASASTARSRVRSEGDVPEAFSTEDPRKARKNTREKMRRQEINEKFDELTKMLGISPSLGANGKVRMDKDLILKETIAAISELRSINKQLTEEKMQLVTSLLTLAAALQHSQEQSGGAKAPGRVMSRSLGDTDTATSASESASFGFGHPAYPAGAGLPFSYTAGAAPSSMAFTRH